MMKKIPYQIPFLLLLALIALCLLWEAWLSPLRGVGTGSILVLKVVPLIFAIKGFAQDRLYTYKWMSLAVWLYFIEGIVRGWSNHAIDKGLSSNLAWGEAMLSILLFIAVVIRIKHIRNQTHQTTPAIA